MVFYFRIASYMGALLWLWLMSFISRMAFAPRHKMRMEVPETINTTGSFYQVNYIGIQYGIWIALSWPVAWSSRVFA